MRHQDQSNFTLKPSIPQLFYDIIARIVPGAVIIGILALAYAGPEKSAQVLSEWLNKPGDSYPSIIVMVVFGFMVSYTVAIVLLGLCHIISKLVPNRLTSGSSDDEFPMKYDFVKTRDPEAGNRITKWTAERHMTSILTLGLSFGLVINSLKMWASPDGSRLILMLMIILAIAGSVGAYYYFIDRQKHGILNYCKLLGYTEWQAEQTIGRAKSLNTDVSIKP
jgi:amino acid transporter